ncbi:MAG TPA: FlgD immunoglobulin-like domain containing protein, partial [Polyangiales bacterium]|nr:FlgD immunoglobulin-like domain containing protein [Polyangiales bacterium]
PSLSGTYAVRVRIPATVTDAASARNALPASSRCVVYSTLSAPPAAATPQLLATPVRVFSPDNDENVESVTWNVSADAATTLLRLRISRAGRGVYGKLVPVTQAGPYSLSWDGADSSGRIVSNGAYGYTIEALNRAGTASAPLRGYVEVDTAVRFVTLRRKN